MEAASNLVRNQTSSESLTIRPADLLTAFTRFADKISVLSLDCFDTLLWRNTITPKDVFFDLQQRPHNKKHNIHAFNRIDSESSARAITMTRFGHAEVTLMDIYKQGFPSLSEAEINELIEEEIDAEIEACYAFPVVVDLIREAHAKNIKIIIVSNTYLTNPQLLKLLKSKLPNDVFAMIDTLFCSCEYNQSKNNALFDEVLRTLQISPNAILHVGDNHGADFVAPRQRNMHALHLLQFDSKQAEYFRLQTTAATIADTSIHRSRPLLNPFRGVFAAAKLQTNKPETLIGYMSMGPVMYTFARFIHDEIEQLKKANKRPKILFLLRDGYLPFLACKTLLGTEIGTMGRISRYCAIAASFRTEHDIATYLTGNVDPEYLGTACRQLLLSDSIAKPLMQHALATHDPAKAFIQLVLQKDIVNIILQNSMAFYQRLKKYLLKLIPLEKDDTLVLVDVGYTGRTQTTLASVLESDLNIKVRGLYLISLNSAEWRRNRKGLMDSSWCDDRALNALKFGNPSLEELICSCDNSVQGYDEEGNPIFVETSVSTAQREQSQLIHQECLRFINDADAFTKKANVHWPIESLRDTVFAELLRRTYLPLEDEIKHLQEFLHDEDMGTNLYGKIFSDSDITLENLRRKGLQFKKQDPYSYRVLGLELSLVLLSNLRHGLELTLSDLNMRHETLQVIKSQNQKIVNNLTQAYHTYDGYFSLWFPVNNMETQIAVLFGKNYELLQIESAELIPAKYFYTTKERNHTHDLLEQVFLNQMQKTKGNLYECQSDTAAMIFQLNHNPQLQDKNFLRVVFRPLVKIQVQS